MIVIKFYELHFVAALCTFERVIAERQKDILAPFSKSLHQAVPGIETVVTCHFKVFFRDALNQELYKI